MASLTIRRLDEETKRRLRLRAAEHGRSLEEELRLLLAEAAAADAPAREPAMPAAPVAEAAPAIVPSLAGARILLVIAGGIAAYKSLDLIRRLRERGASVRSVMTKAATEFVTPMAVGAIAGGAVFTELFDRAEEHDIGHIRLAREADLVVVAPATADLMARMAAGLAGDLAGAVLLATRAPVLLAPAMNPAMWLHPATARNVARLKSDGIRFIGPEAGEMAESGEAGTGRMAEPLAIVAAAGGILHPGGRALAGRHVVVTSGPTHEPIDPVRYIANRSSGRQGHAIAAAAAAAGAKVTLVSGPVGIPDPKGVAVVRVETARQMLAAVEAALPADVLVMTAAVADWRTESVETEKIKKQAGREGRTVTLVENPDILSTIAHRTKDRPTLVVGFAAETQNVVAYARDKLARKGCDMIVANDVSTDVMGGAENEVHIVTRDGVEDWPRMAKDEVARRLVERVAAEFGKDEDKRGS